MPSRTDLILDAIRHAANAQEPLATALKMQDNEGLDQAERELTAALRLVRAAKQEPLAEPADLEAEMRRYKAVLDRLNSVRALCERGKEPVPGYVIIETCMAVDHALADRYRKSDE